ncbi:MAG: hypothetical protein ABSD12_30555 [Paraburkholderia sp.]
MSRMLRNVLEAHKAGTLNTHQVLGGLEHLIGDLDNGGTEIHNWSNMDGGLGAFPGCLKE